MISDLAPEHYAQLLRINLEFVYWLSPLGPSELAYLLERASYARQIDDGAGVLIGYAHDVDFPDHDNLEWLRARLDDFFYIDRVIIDAAAQGRGLGRKLYADVENFARVRGHAWLACEVNRRPNNPGSHAFHLRQGFTPLGEQVFPNSGTAVRYYAKPLN